MAIEELIGKEIPPFTFPVERGKIKEFADAIGDDNPMYQGAAGEEILAPPTFTVTKAFWRQGTVGDLTGLDPRFRLHGEEEYEYFQPIRAGDVLTCRGRIANAYEKAGKRGGKMIFVIFEFTYHNQKDEKVLTTRTTTIQTEGTVKE